MTFTVCAMTVRQADLLGKLHAAEAVFAAVGIAVDDYAAACRAYEATERVVVR